MQMLLGISKHNLKEFLIEFTKYRSYSCHVFPFFFKAIYLNSILAIHSMVAAMFLFTRTFQFENVFN